MADEIRVGIAGYGFMGRNHARAYQWAAERAGLPVRVVAIADAGGVEALRSSGGNLGATDAVGVPDDAEILTDAHALFESDRVDLVSVCTPTPTHVDLAIAALKAGKHVLVEKPVAIEPGEVERIIEAASPAARRGLVCMPGMCMRHWPEWAWLRDAIDSGEHGAVRSAAFTRIGPRPTWSGFYADETRSGGAARDLHIHDADFVLHCFGMPATVTSRGDASGLTTLYGFGGGAEAGRVSPGVVSATGAWVRTPGFPFTMRYLVEFEGGVADFDIARDPTLLWHGPDASGPVEVAPGSGYDHQAAHVARVILGESDPLVTLEDALAGVRIVEAELRSAKDRAAAPVLPA